MRTLTARLVATTLVLVALASVGIGAATTFAMRSYLLDRLDRDVIGSLARAARPGLGGPVPGLGPGATYPARPARARRSSAGKGSGR